MASHVLAGRASCRSPGGVTREIPVNVLQRPVIREQRAIPIDVCLSPMLLQERRFEYARQLQPANPDLL